MERSKLENLIQSPEVLQAPAVLTEPERREQERQETERRLLQCPTCEGLSAGALGYGKVCTSCTMKAAAVTGVAVAGIACYASITRTLDGLRNKERQE